MRDIYLHIHLLNLVKRQMHLMSIFPCHNLFTFGTLYKNLVCENMIVCRLRSICFHKVTGNLFYLMSTVPVKESVTQSSRRQCRRVKTFYVVTLPVCDKVLSDFT